MIPFILATIGGYLIGNSMRVDSYKKGGLIAPNGKPSNLTPEQYKLVRTPEFKAWFGDWEYDPENASKVVDSNGEPLVAYHGTKKIFTKFFEKKYLGSEADALNFFTTNIGTSITDYDGWIVYPCFIKLIFPLNKLTRTPEGSIMEEKQNGFNTDGFMFSNGKVVQKPNIELETWIGVPKSNQIKLASKPIVRIKNKNFIEKYQKTFDSNNNTTFDGSNPDIRYKKGGLIAPNGKPSNLTPEQYKLVRTAEFKAWFGDWENDPANASKVVDENGEPLVVYHGTNQPFLSENLKLKPQYAKHNDIIFFASNSRMAKRYGKNVFEIFVNMKKEQKEDILNDNGDWKLNKKKYDGFFIADFGAVGSINQIKLADGTNKTFDGDNPDIRFDNGGKVDYNTSELQSNQYFIYDENKETIKNDEIGTFEIISNSDSFSIKLNRKKDGSSDAFLYLEYIDKNGFIELDFISIENPQMRGRGIASILFYLTLWYFKNFNKKIKGIKSKYKSSFSDSPRTADAERMWNRLKQNKLFTVKEINRDFYIKLADDTKSIQNLYIHII